MKRLVLGTAQLGMNYGISNRTGKPDLITAESIVKTAWDSGIREFDTAQAYGNSEQVLGTVLHSFGISNKVNVISKFHPDLDHLNHNDMRQALEKTLSDLGISTLYGIMLHREEFLDFWDKGLGEIFMGFARSGYVKHLGVSVYSPAKAVQALETEGITIVQVPTNIFDRRFEKSGIFDLAKNKGKTIYIRSIFLQGLFFLHPNSLPEHLKAASSSLTALAALSRDVGLEIPKLCIGYIKHSFPRAQLVFGSESPSQVRNNVVCWNTAWWPDGLTQIIQGKFKDIDEMILDPQTWMKGSA
jgi:aryl-alcohol dehydrogenase-like predicted oxidoreductase